MATHVKAFLEGELPYQSAVYVVIDTTKNSIHVQPATVSGRYTIAEGQYRFAYEYPGEIDDYLKAKGAELGVDKGLWDKCGFYMGVKSTDLQIFDLITTEHQTDYAIADLAIAYAR